MKKTDFKGQADTFLKSEKKTAPTPEIEVPTGYTLARESKTKRLNLLIRPSVFVKLQEKAKLQGSSVNDYINRLIEEDIAK